MGCGYVVTRIAGTGEQPKIYQLRLYMWSLIWKAPSQMREKTSDKPEIGKIRHVYWMSQATCQTKPTQIGVKICPYYRFGGDKHKFHI